MLGASTWHSLGTTGAANINKFSLGSGAKLHFGFAQDSGYKVLCFLFYAGPLAF
jgi:hypothetical protein